MPEVFEYYSCERSPYIVQINKKNVFWYELPILTLSSLHELVQLVSLRIHRSFISITCILTSIII